MRRQFAGWLALILALTMACFALTACGGNKEDEEDIIEEETAIEEELEEIEQGPAVVKTIDGIDEDLGPRLPLEISSIILYEDGSLEIIPVDDLRKNEIKDDAEGVYPFEESGKVQDVWVVDYGNGGYRTIAALMEDGSISVVNGPALVEDHIFAVIDNVAGRDNFVSIENTSDEGGSAIIGVTEDGSEVILDYSLNF